MDGIKWSMMIQRLIAKGNTSYTDGDIIAEYAIYCTEQAAGQ